MYLLNKNQYYKALNVLKTVSANHLFARSVVEQHVSGKVYADHPANPSAFYVVHPYGMALLFGDSDNQEFHRTLTDYMLNKNGERDKTEWMQAYPGNWNVLINRLIGSILVPPESNNRSDTIEVHTRANFRFNRDKYNSLKKNLNRTGLHVIRLDKELFEKMDGVVVPKNFWDNAVDFFERGIGFTAVMDNKPACTAYSAYIFDGQLELGIETIPEFRGKGYALITCSALIDYCVENDFEPIWSCRLENTPSYLLAQKLGFEPTITLPYYRLPV